MKRLVYKSPVVAAIQMNATSCICSSGPTGGPDSDFNNGGNNDNFVAARKLYI